MNADMLNGLAAFASSAPFFAIAAILVHYQLKRLSWRRKHRQGRKDSGFCPSSAAMGIMFLFMQAFYRPSVEFVLEERQKEDAEHDDEGDSETPAKRLNCQLQQIRRGEEVDFLVLRL